MKFRLDIVVFFCVINYNGCYLMDGDIRKTDQVSSQLVYCCFLWLFFTTNWPMNYAVLIPWQMYAGRIFTLPNVVRAGTTNSNNRQQLISWLKKASKVAVGSHIMRVIMLVWIFLHFATGHKPEQCKNTAFWNWHFIKWKLMSENV